MTRWLTAIVLTERRAKGIAKTGESFPAPPLYRTHQKQGANRETPMLGDNTDGATYGVLGFDGVGSLSVLTLSGGDSQSHFFAYRAGQEAAHRMGQPARGFYQLFRGCAAVPFQQVEDLGGLTSIACTFGLGNLGLRPAFGRVLGTGGGLTGRLGFGRGTTLGRRGAMRAFLLAFGFLPLAMAVELPFSSGITVVISIFSFWIGVAITTWITPTGLKCKSNLPLSKKSFRFFHLRVGRKRASMDLWLTATERNTQWTQRC